MAKKRLEFAKCHQNWTVSDWENVLWTDESTFQQFGTCVRHVRRPPGQQLNQRYVVQTMKHPPSQMIWGAAGLYFLPKNTTMNGEQYLTLLQEKLEFYMNSHQVTTLMHDGAPCHRAIKVTDWLQSKDIQLLEWPGNSRDCNPIENLLVTNERSCCCNATNISGSHAAVHQRSLAYTNNTQVL